MTARTSVTPQLSAMILGLSHDLELASPMAHDGGLGGL